MSTAAAELVAVKDESIAVLTLREAAVRLGIITDEVEANGQARDGEGAGGGLAVVVPTSEFERGRSGGLRDAETNHSGAL